MISDAISKLLTKPKLTKQEEIIISSFMCVEHWNEVVPHKPEYEYITNLLNEEALKIFR